MITWWRGAGDETYKLQLLVCEPDEPICCVNRAGNLCFGIAISSLVKCSLSLAPRNLISAQKKLANSGDDYMKI